MPVYNKSRIEIYVESYLKQNTFNLKNNNILKKARLLVELKLNENNCNIDESVYNFFTIYDNQFIKVLNNMLMNIDKHNNIKSLKRIISLLNNKIS